MALAFVSARLSTLVTDAPARPASDPSASKADARNWNKATVLLGLVEAMVSPTASARDFREALLAALDCEALEHHSPAHLALADLGALL